MPNGISSWIPSGVFKCFFFPTWKDLHGLRFLGSKVGPQAIIHNPNLYSVTTAWCGFRCSARPLGWFGPTGWVKRSMTYPKNNGCPSGRISRQLHSREMSAICDTFNMIYQPVSTDINRYQRFWRFFLLPKGVVPCPPPKPPDDHLRVRKRSKAL